MKEKMKTIKKENGITLVALVVTIIILLILAGVAINMALGENGLFKKSKEAVNTWKSAEENETGVLDYLYTEWDNIINGGTGNPPTSREPTIVKIGDEEVPIPAGFTKVGAEDPTAGQTVADGIVVRDPQGNEWVWVPCYVEGGKGSNIEGRIAYARYIFGDQVFDETDNSKIYSSSSDKTYNFNETLSETSPEYQSIKEYGGYYMGRFEAGDKDLSESETPRLRTISDKSEVQTHKVSIKKNQAPYNWVTQAQCITLSEGMTSADGTDTNKLNGTEVFTKLCSSYSWDTALKFIEKKYSEYPTNSTQGSYNNTKFSYKDITGQDQTRTEKDGVLVPTGQTMPVCSIYDMGGNVWEYTTENYTKEERECVYRGGFYSSHASVSPSSRRDYWSGNPGGNSSFRPTLFLK